MTNKIFYYRHTNNEIYQLRFKKVIINLEGRYHKIVKGFYDVSYIEAEVASLGTLTWKYGGLIDNTLMPKRIFETIELAINGKEDENLLKAQIGNGLPWDCNIFDIDDIEVPEHIRREVCKDILGTRIRYITWVWNGLEPCLKSGLGINPITKKNSVGIHYDVINHIPYYDTSIKGYATKEECIANNVVKVHCF